MAYRSLVAQTIHYLARPHLSRPTGPVGGPSAWRGDALRKEGSWRETLTADQLTDIERALDVAEASGRPLRKLRARDIPFESLRADVDRWRDQLANGRGFVVLSGLPVQRWKPGRAERFFFGLGLHLGVPGAQNPDGDVLGHVKDQGGDYAAVRGYKTRAALNFHCDAADVVGLLCLQSGRTGGVSRIASSSAILDELRGSAPVDRLFEITHLDTRGEGGVKTMPIQPSCYAEGRLSTFYHSDYFRTASTHSHVGPLDADLVAVLDAFDAKAHDPNIHLEMELNPGDVQLLSNHTCVHARTEYEDDPQNPRHLLRLWLSLRTKKTDKLRTHVSRATHRLKLITRLLRTRAQQNRAT
ncbi:MAG: hypothetical protein ACI9WU_000427 [Myxococcota bacterium]|jgi:hypothetical protein